MNMKKKSLFAAALLAGSVAQAGIQTNKTFLMPRSLGVDIAMENAGWHRQIHRPRREDAWGVQIQAVGFYANSGTRHGNYFGFDSKRSLKVGTVGATTDIDSKYLIHNSSGSNTLAGTLNLNWTRDVGGVLLSYFQNLDCIHKGVYFRLNVPVAHASTRAKVSVTDETKQSITNTSGASQSVGILDYFKGNIAQQAGINQQAALKYAKIDQTSHSETGVADLDFLMGWDFWRTADHNVGFNVGVSFPTAPDAKGEWVFEPMIGNSHWGLGAGVDASYTPWKDDDQAIQLFTKFNYRYLFEGDEMRVVGLRNKNWGQYMLLGEVGVTGVFPAANVLRQKVDVEPGSQFDYVMGAAYLLGGFTFDLGFNLFARCSDRLNVRSWNDSKYAIAGNNYSGAAVFAVATDVATTGNNIQATTVKAAGVALKKTDLDPETAAQAGYATYKLLGNVSYVWEDWENPLMLKLGGFYEFGSRKDIEQWGLFGGFGFDF